jgi:hypothetical protein
MCLLENYAAAWRTLNIASRPDGLGKKGRALEGERCPMSTSHHHSLRRSFLVTAAVAITAMLLGSGLFGPAQAGYMVTLEQVGSNVVATGSGTINLTALNFTEPASTSSILEPGGATISTGANGQPGVGTAIDIYGLGSGLISGPKSFGSEPNTLANSGTGDMVGIDGLNGSLAVPDGYVSGNSLSDTATYDNATIASVHVAPGTYVWVWGSGADADSFTLQIGPAAVPAPLIGHGLPVLLAVGGILFGAKLLERGKADASRPFLTASAASPHRIGLN